MHFGILKTTEETQRLVISPLVATRVGTDSVVRASRLNRPQVWDSGSLGSDESRKSFDLYVL